MFTHHHRLGGSPAECRGTAGVADTGLPGGIVSIAGRGGVMV
jgi:hypothetical protein